VPERRYNSQVDALAKLLLRQEKIATDEQLADAGVTRGMIRWKLARGNWQRILPRVVATFSGSLSRRQQILAAALYAGRRSQIAGPTALELHGVRYAPTEPMVHVLVPHDRQLSANRRVHVHRTRRLDSNAWPLGVLSVCSPGRAAVDAMLGSVDQRVIRAVIAEVVQSQMTTVAELRHELELAPRRGSARLRDVIAEVADGVRSAPEAELRQLAVKTDCSPRSGGTRASSMPRGMSCQRQTDTSKKRRSLSKWTRGSSISRRMGGRRRCAITTC